VTSARPPILLEVILAAAIAAMFAVWSGATQHPTSAVTWDAQQYYLIASQLAAGQTPAAEAPYVYRLGVPWIVAQVWPADPARGFYVFNLLCALLAAPLLSLWLRTGVDRFAVRLAMVALFASAWHGPVRYVHFNGGYVDPPFLLFVLLALALLHAIRTRPRPWLVAAFGVLTIAGTLVRETMILLPMSALLMAKNGTPESWRPGLNWIMAAPIAAGGLTIAFTHAIVDADTTRSFVAAALQWIRKPPTAYLLAWFTAYGPVLALLVFDGRRVIADLKAQPHQMIFLGLCAVLAFMGGSDTERFVFWAMPVVYLLLGRAFERHLPELKGAAIAAGLVMAQAISARIFWPIPDPGLETAPLAETASWPERFYAFFDRLLVIDHFHWNLWSSFGSAPFRSVRLAFYVLVTAAIVAVLRRRARELRPQ
jgi:hypothetical protein